MVRHRHAPAHRPQCHRAVHGARVDVDVSKFRCDSPREGVLARTGRSIDRDCDALGQIIMKAHARGDFPSPRAGATLITINRRLARSFARDFHAWQARQGRTVWRPPEILPLDAFLHRAWNDWVWRGTGDNGLALLNPLQEQVVWEQIIRASPAGETLLRIPETARLASESWQLVQAYRVPLDARFEASDDWAAFAGWSREFENRCRLSVGSKRRASAILLRSGSATAKYRAPPRCTSRVSMNRRRSKPICSPPWTRLSQSSPCVASPLSHISSSKTPRRKFAQPRYGLAA